MKIKRIYCDMDGVIVDFTKDFEKASGKTLGTWDKPNNISNEELYKITASTPNFWSNMSWMLDGKELVSNLKKICNENGIEFWILSAPAHPLYLDRGSVPGKKEWLMKNIPDVILKNRVILETDKSIYAKPDCILIDDRDHNIRDWIAKGGIGILYKNTKDALKELEEKLLK